MISTFSIFIHLNYYLIFWGNDVLVKKVINIYVKFYLLPYSSINLKSDLYVFVYLLNICFFTSFIFSF